MNPSFVLVLKSERCIDISKTDNFYFLVKRDTKIVKVKAKQEPWTLNLEKKEFLSQNLNHK